MQIVPNPASQTHTKKLGEITVFYVVFIFVQPSVVMKHNLLYLWTSTEVNSRVKLETDVIQESKYAAKF